MIEMMMKNLLLSFGVTEEKLQGAIADFHGLALAAKTMEANSHKVYALVEQVNNNVLLLRDELREKTDGASYPDFFEPMTREHFLSPPAQLTLDEKEDGEHVN